MGVIQPVQWEVLVTAVSHQFPEKNHGPSHVIENHQAWSHPMVLTSKLIRKMMKLRVICPPDLPSKLLAKGDYKKKEKKNQKLEALTPKFFGHLKIIKNDRASKKSTT